MSLYLVTLQHRDDLGNAYMDSYFVKATSGDEACTIAIADAGAMGRETVHIVSWNWEG